MLDRRKENTTAGPADFAPSPESCRGRRSEKGDNGSISLMDEVGIEMGWAKIVQRVKEREIEKQK